MTDVTVPLLVESIYLDKISEVTRFLLEHSELDGRKMESQTPCLSLTQFRKASDKLVVQLVTKKVQSHKLGIPQVVGNAS